MMSFTGWITLTWLLTKQSGCIPQDLCKHAGDTIRWIRNPLDSYCNADEFNAL